MLAKLYEANAAIQSELYRLKFALEQDTSADGHLAAIQKLRDVLDLTIVMQKLLDRLALYEGPGDESNPLLVDTLSNSLNKPFGSEPPTNVVIKEKK
jgi:hypothetical protein